MFTFTGRISAKRKAPDAVVFDEGIAPAISEEKNTADGRLAAGRKLTVKVNMAPLGAPSPFGNVSPQRQVILNQNLG